MFHIFCRGLLTAIMTYTSGQYAAAALPPPPPHTHTRHVPSRRSACHMCCTTPCFQYFARRGEGLSQLMLLTHIGQHKVCKPRPAGNTQHTHLLPPTPTHKCMPRCDISTLSAQNFTDHMHTCSMYDFHQNSATTAITTPPGVAALTCNRPLRRPVE